MLARSSDQRMRLRKSRRVYKSQLKQLPDSNDPNRMTKSSIPAMNAPNSFDVQEGHNQVATKSMTCFENMIDQ